MVTAGTNCITIAEDSLRTMLAASSAFQDWVTDFDATHVPADHIHTYFAPLPGFVSGAARKQTYDLTEIQTLGRHALIGTFFEGGSVAFTIDSVSHGYEHLPKADLWCQFSTPVDPTVTALDEEMRLFLNAVVNVLEQLLNAANVDDNLSIKSITVEGAGINDETRYPTQYQELMASCLIFYDSQG